MDRWDLKTSNIHMDRGVYISSIKGMAKGVNIARIIGMV
jgi:hypothetical protein